MCTGASQAVRQGGGWDTNTWQVRWCMKPTLINTAGFLLAPRDVLRCGVLPGLLKWSLSARSLAAIDVATPGNVSADVLLQGRSSLLWVDVWWEWRLGFLFCCFSSRYQWAFSFVFFTCIYYLTPTNPVYFCAVGSRQGNQKEPASSGVWLESRYEIPREIPAWPPSAMNFLLWKGESLQ